MTTEDVDKMEAGRELDLLIIKAVFGLEPQECMVGGHPRGCTGNITYPPYSTDIAAAWQVVEKTRLFTHCDITQLDDKWAISNWANDSSVEADTAPLAICRAALKAISAEPQ